MVVDTRSTARRIVWGELYAVLQSKGPVLWQVNRWTVGKVIGEKGPYARLSPLNVYRGNLEDLPMDATKILHLSDGPITLPDLRKDLIGRAVGLINPRERFDRQMEEATLRHLLRKKQEREQGIGGTP